MRKRLFSLAAAVAAILWASPAADACTNIIVTKGASKDGSVMVTYSADSHVLYGELYRTPAADHAPGTMLKIFDWDSGRYMGQIPQIAHTYSTIGNMNEHQLIITETTFGGLSQLRDKDAIMDYGSLIYVTLQRAKTAREAIDTLTSLANEYGYASSGESFTIADKNEVWILELIGKGSKIVNGKNVNKGAVWVAVRIPDGYISSHANQARIRQFPLDDPDNCIYSPDVISFAKNEKLYKGKDADFSFADVYNPLDFSGMRGCEARVWSAFNRFADGMDEYVEYAMGHDTSKRMPLYVKPKARISVKELADMMRDHYEDTPMDMRYDIGAGGHELPYRWRPMTFTCDGVEYTNERAIATQQTGFWLLGQARSWLPDEVGGILWFGVDDANTCVYVPVFNGGTAVPHEFAVGNGDLYNLSWESAFWINNYVANQAYYRYSQMIPDIRRVQNAIEDTFEAEMPDLEKEIAAMNAGDAASRLNDYTASRTTDYTRRYKALGDYLFVKYMDGNVKREKNGEFERTPEGMPEYPMFPGYDERYYRSIAKDPSGGERLKSLIIK